LENNSIGKQPKKSGKLKNGNPSNVNGRPKGSKNRFTNLRDAFLEAFDKTGGAEGLVDWINKHQKNRADFYRMITKMLPANVNFTPTGDFTVIISDKYLPKNGK
jgi:hypothetical protein